MCLTLFTWFRFLKVKELQFGTPSNPLISEAPYSSNLIFNGWNWGFSSLHNHYSLISHFNSNNSIIIVVVAVICLKWLTFSGYDKLFLQILYSVGWNSNLLCSEMEFILMVFMVNRFLILETTCIGLFTKGCSATCKWIGYEKHHNHLMID